MRPTEEQLRMMRYAVGKRWSRYVSAKGTQEDSDWAALERAGLAREFRDGVCTRTWHVTEEGQALLRSLEPSPKPQPSDLPPRFWHCKLCDDYFLSSSGVCRCCKSRGVP